MTNDDTAPAALSEQILATLRGSITEGDRFAGPWHRLIERFEAGQTIELARHLLPAPVRADLPAQVRTVMVRRDGTDTPARGHVDWPR